VQLADAPKMQMDYLSWSRHFRNMPGQGELPLVDYVATLLERGYKGTFSLEIFNDRFRSASASSVAVDGRRSLSYLQDQVARRLAPRTAPPIFPPRARARGVEFIEFAANEEETPQLAALFASLGFEAVGRHRHKDVTRWRQNGIHFVINSEPDSFARAYDGMHGASVCALGLNVDDVGGALRRAEGLRIERFNPRPEPGDLLIPALLGVGGSLLYLIEEGTGNEMWEREFEPLPSATRNAGAGLLRVDHIAQTMQYEEMLSWLLYYVSLFDLARAPAVQIADPLGLVQSQAIESPEGGVRFTLNGSASHQTLSARFLQGFGGAGVQHIALATADIFATAARLKELGLPTLPIPRNYYEDLEARFDLDEKRLTRLAELNILYDRDTDGEYFQLYSRAFAKRFFFEIVERRGYGAYGAANAPIRLAAQSRYRDDMPF
jgi:4-hydroxyphenylpyruvate dioxygenase